MNVVEAPIVTPPLMVIAALAANVTEEPVPMILVRLPAMVIELVGMVFVTAPLLLLRVKLP